MQISIITATYNSSRTLRDTFNSVLSQSYENIEYIVIDGGSKDGTIEIIREYESQFRGRMKWISEPDNGIYDAMNKGFKMAKGEVLAIINSDDLFYDRDAIKKVVESFEKDSQLGVVYADLYYVKSNDVSQIVRRWESGPQKSFKSGWHPAHPTFYAKRSIYEEKGYFNLKYKIAADFELMLRFIENSDIKTFYLQEFLVKMRLGGASSKNLSNIIRGNREVISAFRDNSIHCPIFYPVYRIALKLKQFVK